MMKRSFTAMMFMLLFGAASVRAQGPGPVVKDPNPKPVLLAPDLITDGISYQDLSTGKIQIAVRNIGQAPSAKSLIRILITMPGKTQSTGRSADVRALSPGQIQWISISTGKDLHSVKYCAIADALNQNKESDEKNNQRCGEFTGKL
jgi:hypothetical protein